MYNFQIDIDQSINVLHSGGTILYPTDTIWGIGCDALNPAAIDRIFEIKHRSRSKSMIILVSSEEMIYDYVRSPSPELVQMMTEAENPTTGIFENAINLPHNLINSAGTVAIRIASDLFCKSLIDQFGRPIVSTSANISNEPAPRTFSEITPTLINLVDYTVKYLQDDLTIKNPSHIIRLNEEGEVKRVR